jgi:hypothetical protein
LPLQGYIATKKQSCPTSRTVSFFKENTIFLYRLVWRKNSSYIRAITLCILTGEANVGEIKLLQKIKFKMKNNIFILFSTLIFWSSCIISPERKEQKTQLLCDDKAFLCEDGSGEDEICFWIKFIYQDKKYYYFIYMDSVCSTVENDTMIAKIVAPKHKNIKLNYIQNMKHQLGTREIIITKDKTDLLFQIIN